MNLRYLCAPLGAALIASSASAGIIVIDDFSTGTFASSISSGDEVLQQMGAMLGGQRDVGVAVLDNPFNQTLDVNLQEDALGMAFSSGIGLTGQLSLDYDGMDTETGSLPFVVGDGVALDFSDLTDISFDFLAADLDFSIQVTLQSVMGGSVMDSSSASTDVSASGGPFTSSIALADFDIDLSTVNRIGIVFNFNESGDPTGSLDFILSEIAVVPAPGAIALFGLAGLAGRRRRG